MIRAHILKYYFIISHSAFNFSAASHAYTKNKKHLKSQGLMFAIIVRPELLKYQCILDFVFSWVHKLQIIENYNINIIINIIIIHII